MRKPQLLQQLTVANWERQAGSAAKARPTTVTDALQTLKRLVDAIDDEPFDANAVEDIDGVPEASKRMDAEYDRRVKPAIAAAEAVSSAAGKFASGQNRKDGAGKTAAAAAEAVARTADDYREALQGFLGVSRRELELREKELKGEADKDEAEANKMSPEASRLRTRLIDQMRIVKMRPDQQVLFLLCVGNRQSAAFLGRSASDSNKPLLVKVLKGDGNFKFYRGEVKWEDGAYTFIGKGMSATIARRIAGGIARLTGSNWRIRAHD